MVEAVASNPTLGEHAAEKTPQLRVGTARDAREWDAFVAAHADGTVDHLWAWQDVIRDALGHESRYLVVRRGATAVGVLPLVLVRSRIFGRSVVSMPFLNDGGVLAEDRPSMEALIGAARDVAREFGATHIELRHRRRLAEELPCRQHKLAMTRQLPATPDLLWTDLDRKVRNQVRKAQKEGLELVSGGAELIDEFYGVFATNMRDLGTPVYPRSLFDRALAAFPDRMRVFVVRRSGRAVAGGITVRFGTTTSNPWASSLREFRSLNPNMLLYWGMLEHAITWGARVFDFGRSSPESGTHHFKVQWGAVAERLHWEYVLLSRSSVPQQDPSNSRFHLAIGLWQRLPLVVANAIGPVVARHLP